MKTDYFAAKAGTYEQAQSRVDNVASIADAIRDEVRLDKRMHIVDFGSGTGLLLERADIDRQFDGIVSSMTLHHIENGSALDSGRRER